MNLPRLFLRQVYLRQLGGQRLAGHQILGKREMFMSNRLSSGNFKETKPADS